MALHLVLDHSALIPCGNKPREEKEAIRKLGEVLPEVDAVWYVSKEYFKTLRSACSKKELKQHHPLPRLQSFLMRGLKNLITLTDTKVWLCKQRVLAEGTKLMLHVVARSALKNVSFQEEFKGLSSEDLEVLAVAVRGTCYASSIYVVTTDRLLLQAVDRLELKGLRVKAITPKELVEQLIE